MSRLFTWFFMGSCAFAGGLVAVNGTGRLVSLGLAQTKSSVVLPAPGTDVLQLGDRFEVVARRVGPAVVAVEATKPAGTQGKPRPV